jgi:hypothetical protein
VQILGRWSLRSALNASDGGYHDTTDGGAIFRFPFEGDGFRVGFRFSRRGGSFQIKIDGQVVGVYDANLGDEASQADAYTVVTEAYFLNSGYHLADIVVTSGDERIVAIDYVEVLLSPELVNNPDQVQAGADTLVNVVSYELLVAPPTLLPSPMPVTDQVVSVDVVVAYDENANEEVDPAEGVRAISVRAVDATTNALLASAITDDAGFVRLQVTTRRDVLVVIPLLGESFLVRVRRATGVATSWTVLLEPANLPGLIP